MDLSESEVLRRAYGGQLFPKEQFECFRYMRHSFPSRKVPCGSVHKPLKYDLCDLSKLIFKSNDKMHDIYDLVSRNRIVSLLVLHKEKIKLEHYDFGQTQQSQWISMSMAKSISTTLVGIAIQQGLIDSIDDPLMKYLPQLDATSYQHVTIRQLLLMSSGVQWNEDHTNPHSERRAVLELQFAQEPGAILRYMGQLPALYTPGSTWNYSTGETHLVGELLRAVTGQWLADYLSENLWQPLGMEADAHWWLESDDGLEIAGSGLNACARDYARFGLFMLNNGKIEGQQILPPDWCSAAAGPTIIDQQVVPYGYMWWSVPDPKPATPYGAYCARGIYGQRLYINPAKDIVIVSLAARSKPLGDDYIDDYDFYNAVSEYLTN